MQFEHNSNPKCDCPAGAAELLIFVLNLSYYLSLCYADQRQGRFSRRVAPCITFPACSGLSLGPGSVVLSRERPFPIIFSSLYIFPALPRCGGCSARGRWVWGEGRDSRQREGVVKEVEVRD